MKYATLLLFVVGLTSCWKDNTGLHPGYRVEKVWGSKPVYASIDAAKKYYMTR